MVACLAIDRSLAVYVGVAGRLLLLLFVCTMRCMCLVRLAVILMLIALRML